MIEFAFSWISKYVGPTPSNCGGAIGRGGSVWETKKKKSVLKQKLEKPLREGLFP